MKNAILFGATSEIGAALIDEFCASEEWRIVRAGSYLHGVEEKVEVDLVMNWEKVQPIQDFASQEIADLEFDFVVISLGYLPGTDLQTAGSEIVRSTFANFLWPLLCLEFLENKKLVQDSGVVVVVSSALVALPPTKKSYFYTILKSSLESAVSNGIRFGFFRSNIIFLRPGFVPTKINQHLSPGKFATTPTEVAKKTIQKIKNGKRSGVVYAPSQIVTLIFVSKFLPLRFRRWVLSLLQKS